MTDVSKLVLEDSQLVWEGISGKCTVRTHAPHIPCAQTAGREGGRNQTLWFLSRDTQKKSDSNRTLYIQGANSVSIFALCI